MVLERRDRGEIVGTLRTAASAILIVLVSACQSSPTPGPAQQSPSPTLQATSAATPIASPIPVAGGCGDTQAFAGPGPDADLGLADNPWASATPAASGIVAYFWHAPPNLIFAHGPSDGTKVLWVSHDTLAAKLLISAHPFGAESPVVRSEFPVAGSPAGNYPSGIDLPRAGCWRLEITLGTTYATLDVNVAPAQGS